MTKKEMEQKKKEELAELFKPVQAAQKVPFGVDPKTILCQYFKNGACTKGKNCKFSHDLNVERKADKIDLYTDTREEAKKDDTMDKWDQDKLEEVVQTKHGKNPATTTDIVCKYFIQAVEERKYGWFWNCPNGTTCKYRHALPPGFKLKDQKKNLEKEEVKTLEEWIEEQRTNLPAKLTPVTLETFTKWKEDRIKKKEKEEEDLKKQKETAAKAGKLAGFSGRELFTYNPDMAMGDDEDAWEGDYTQREDIQEEDEMQQNGESQDDADMADGHTDHKRKREPNASSEAIDESLFTGEDLENLDIDDDDEDE